MLIVYYQGRPRGSSVVRSYTAGAVGAFRLVEVVEVGERVCVCLIDTLQHDRRASMSDLHQTLLGRSGL